MAVSLTAISPAAGEANFVVRVAGRVIPTQTRPRVDLDFASNVIATIMIAPVSPGKVGLHAVCNPTLPGCGLWVGYRQPKLRSCLLTEIDVRPSPLSSMRNIVDVLCSYTNRKTDFTERFFVRVDVTEEFPFLVTKLSPYYDR